MIDFKNIDGIYFIGIGGIGMSSLALYFRKGGYTIGGYDRISGSITDSLTEHGCMVTFEDRTSEIPSFFSNCQDKSRILAVYTPAIPIGNRILSFFRDNGYRLVKRAEVLGEISLHTDTLAVAGTHGKTTTTALRCSTPVTSDSS